jgi:hypothetical protein
VRAGYEPSSPIGPIEQSALRQTVEGELAMSVWNAGLRVAFGSLVYILILVLAAQIPSAAGMMLTFPALNGLGLLFTEQSEIPDTARSMLWMPVVNGVLCASFIFFVFEYGEYRLSDLAGLVNLRGDCSFLVSDG